MKQLTSTEIRIINRNQESARQNLWRQQERDRQVYETTMAKQIQQQTGCSWSEAIRAVLERKI